MPSPLAHTAAGIALYLVGRPALSEKETPRTGRIPTLGLVTVGFSLLPDIDSVVGLLTGNFGRYHNNLTHSLFVGLVLSLLPAAYGRRRGGAGAAVWYLAALLPYALHLLMDAANVGRGIMALWPLTTDRFQLPFPLFYGFHWSDGLLSVRHIWTFVTEALFALALLGGTRFAVRWRARGGK